MDEDNFMSVKATGEVSERTYAAEYCKQNLPERDLTSSARTGGYSALLASILVHFLPAMLAGPFDRELELSQVANTLNEARSRMG